MCLFTPCMEFCGCVDYWLQIPIDREESNERMDKRINMIVCKENYLQNNSFINLMQPFV